MGKKNEIEDIITAVIVAVKNAGKVDEPKSDLEKRGKFIVTTFYDNGCMQLQHYADTKAEAEAWLQKPENLGKTMTISKEVACLTTQIPLVNVTGEE